MRQLDFRASSAQASCRKDPDTHKLHMLYTHKTQTSSFVIYCTTFYRIIGQWHHSCGRVLYGTQGGVPQHLLDAQALGVVHLQHALQQVHHHRLDVVRALVAAQQRVEAVVPQHPEAGVAGSGGQLDGVKAEQHHQQGHTEGVDVSSPKIVLAWAGCDGGGGEDDGRDVEMGRFRAARGCAGGGAGAGVGETCAYGVNAGRRTEGAEGVEGVVGRGAGAEAAVDGV